MPLGLKPTALLTALLLASACSSVGPEQADGSSNAVDGHAADAQSDAAMSCSGQSLTCDEPDTICVTSPFDRDAGGVCLPCGMPDQHCCPNEKSADQWRCPDGYSCELYLDTPPYCKRVDGGPG